MTENGQVRSNNSNDYDNPDEEYPIDLDQLADELENGDSRFIQIEDQQNRPRVPPRTSSRSSRNREQQLKRVDFVLVYRTRTNANNQEAPQNFEYIRKIYEENLEQEGLVLAHVNSTVTNEYCYVHIYAPWDVLARYAEVMALRMPMRTMVSRLNVLYEEENLAKDAKSESIETPASALKKNQDTYTTVFSRDKEYLFAIPANREDFFTPSQRSEIIEFILRRTRFQKDHRDVFSIGINKLVNDGCYVAAYPLHDETSDCDKGNKCPTDRCQLKSRWASLWCLFNAQPFDKIVSYMGIRISMYFCWVGFYTYMLIPPALAGLASVLYGWWSMSSSAVVTEVCTFDNTTLMCPNCAINCNYSQIAESCPEVKVSHIFGNWTTILFAVGISLWATIYLEMWKRYSAKISYNWDLSDFSTIDEYPRPEFLANISRTKKTRVNPITRLEEPYIPFVAGRLPYFIISSSFVLLCIVMALVIMVSIIAYRVSVQIALYAQFSDSHFLSKYADNVVTLTAAFINLFLILLLSWLYKKLAYFLTELEVPRTQFEFDNSLTLKMFLFEFVNYYSSFFYIAFIKGRFRAQPPEGGLKPSTASRHYLIESCPLGGCYIDLTVQMFIIFVGKAILNGIAEYLWPYMNSVFNRRAYLRFGRKKSTGSTADVPKNLQQWEEDYLLESWNHMSLFYEYLELIIQFGFVTIFVSAFPLAPLLAFVNNIFEIRLDARKMLLNFKRPVAQRVKGIGIWYPIMDTIGKLSVFTNSMIIGFTTDIVPQIVYFYQNGGSMKGYFRSTLAYYQITPDDPKVNAPYCLYTAYREDPWTFGAAYQYKQIHWTMLICRIVFVLVFQNTVAALNSLLKAIIPDVPRKVMIATRQHKYLTNELIIRHELVKRSQQACDRFEAMQSSPNSQQSAN